MTKKFVYEIRESWSTDNDGNSHHVSDIIVNNEKQVQEYLERNYRIDEMQDISDGISIIYEKTARYSVSDHGNLIEIDQCDECDKIVESGSGFDNCCNEHFYQTDIIEALPYYEHEFKGKPATKAQIEYLTSGKHWTNVIDMTEEVLNQ